MKSFALLLAILLSVSCQTTTPPRAIILTPPQKQAAVAPPAIKVQSEVARIDQLSRELKEASETAVVDSKLLADKGVATPQELTDMWKLLTGQDKVIKKLVDESSKAKTSADKLSELAIKKDTEAELLRQGNETLIKKSELDDKYIGKASKKLEKQAGDAQIGKWLRWAVIGGAILAVIAIILFVLTKLGVIAAKVAT